ncbi:hypothetical protein GCM10009838_78960 [Catenulispora subtropica]|uniref:Uncharacterized protein n=1 Tax=Catenulispora subtropica TaxID=450798 RepID=A0ABP5EPF2_9ACTN
MPDRWFDLHRDRRDSWLAGQHHYQQPHGRSLGRDLDLGVGRDLDVDSDATRAFHGKRFVHLHAGPDLPAAE